MPAACLLVGQCPTVATSRPAIPCWWSSAAEDDPHLAHQLPGARPRHGQGSRGVPQVMEAKPSSRPLGWPARASPGERGHRPADQRVGGRPVLGAVVRSKKSITSTSRWSRNRSADARSRARACSAACSGRHGFGRPTARHGPGGRAPHARRPGSRCSRTAAAGHRGAGAGTGRARPARRWSRLVQQVGHAHGVEDAGRVGGRGEQLHAAIHVGQRRLVAPVPECGHHPDGDAAFASQHQRDPSVGEDLAHPPACLQEHVEHGLRLWGRRWCGSGRHRTTGRSP